MGVLGEKQEELESILIGLKPTLIKKCRQLLKDELVTDVWGYCEDLARFFYRNKELLDHDQYEYLCSFPDAMIEEILNEVMK